MLKFTKIFENECKPFTRVNIYRELRIHLYYKSILGEAYSQLLTVKETTKFI